jgi:epoxyqueuosine reductase
LLRCKQTLKELVAGLAREEGAVIRVTSASNDEGTQEQLRAAFRRGDFATWGYDDAYAARAADPNAILAGARSVICVAIPYSAERTIAHAGKRAELGNMVDGWRLRSPSQGRVSNYAWPGEDYHKRVRGVLSKIARVLDESAGVPVTAFVCDTTPFAERAFAARSGLGWIGKHTNLISPELGSFVFLGEIITTLELPIDVPLKKTCGSCTRCVTACPTGALRGDYTIDATRCISDLTQRKDGIPRAMRPFIGTWIWGCDICQLVCPPTQRATALRLRSQAHYAQDDMQGVSGDAQPSLLALVRMRGGEFKRTFKATAMGWRGAAVLRRNAAVALGNSGDRSSVPTLVQALNEDPHPMVRGHIAWALGRIGSPQAFAALRERHTIETDTTVREEITSALSFG